MRIVKFSADNVANELADITDEELDGLAFGAIELDRTGRIPRYNAAEADISERVRPAWSGAIFSRMLRRVRAAKRLKDAFAPV